MAKQLLFLISCVALAACGGGDGGTGSSPTGSLPTPSPLPAPTPAPTPTPSPAVTGELKPTSDAQFFAANMNLTTDGPVRQAEGNLVGGATRERSTILDPAQFRAMYQNGSGYSFSNAVASAGFGSANVLSDTTGPSQGGIIVYSRENGAVLDYLALYKLGARFSGFGFNGYVEPKYGGIGAWQHTLVNSGVRQTQLNYFAYGPTTPTQSMPRNGVRKYYVSGYGNFADKDNLWFIQISGYSFSVDFSTGQLTGDLSVSGSNFFTNGFGGLGGFQFSQLISTNSAIISFTNPNVNVAAFANMPVTARVTFIGPSAEEVLITLVANDGSKAVSASIIGVIDPR